MSLYPLSLSLCWLCAVKWSGRERRESSVTDRRRKKEREAAGVSDREESIYRRRDEELERQRREREAEVQRGREREENPDTIRRKERQRGGGRARHHAEEEEERVVRRLRMVRVLALWWMAEWSQQLCPAHFLWVFESSSSCKEWHHGDIISSQVKLLRSRGGLWMLFRSGEGSWTLTKLKWDVFWMDFGGKVVGALRVRSLWAWNAFLCRLCFQSTDCELISNFLRSDESKGKFSSAGVFCLLVSFICCVAPKRTASSHPAQQTHNTCLLAAMHLPHC